MEIEFEIIYHELVLKEDVPCLPKIWKRKISNAIEEKLTTHPEIFGKPLRRSLSGYRKLRVGDYRVVFCIEKNMIKIFAIKHRKEVYKIVENRNK